MKPQIIILLLFAALFITACRDEAGNTQEGYINLSELKTKSDYYLPFAIRNDSEEISTVILNGDSLSFPEGRVIEFDGNGFYELVIVYDDKSNDTLLFTTTTAERADSEWGIRAWVPVPFEYETLTDEEVTVVYPGRSYGSVDVPFIFFVREADAVAPVYCQAVSYDTWESFNIKRGVGSVNVPASAIKKETDFIIGGKTISAPVERLSASDMELAGEINTSIVAGENTVIEITGSVTITSEGSLTVGEGSIVVIDEAADIVVYGPVVFAGSETNPVLVTCSDRNAYWGGFLAKGSGGSIEAHNTIFCRSGYHDSDDYAWGHAGRQAMFYTENTSLTLDHCYMLDNIGQIFYPVNTTLVLDNILVQRAKTGGQINNSALTIRNSVFTDFPDDTYIFADNDNDALYLNATNAVIENTLFMFAKDDGVDSGGDEGGMVIFTRCRFEACFHEGAALSSSNSVIKEHFFSDCVFTNCGQGLELGFSSPDHAVTIDNCLFLENGVGIRYGDNYKWSDVGGQICVYDSRLLKNHRNVWNMIRKIWGAKLQNMRFENTTASEVCPQYPEIQVEE